MADPVRTALDGTLSQLDELDDELLVLEVVLLEDDEVDAGLDDDEDDDAADDVPLSVLLAEEESDVGAEAAFFAPLPRESLT